MGKYLATPDLNKTVCAYIINIPLESPEIIKCSTTCVVVARVVRSSSKV